MRRRGFTLIEVCIVLALMGLVTTAFLGQFLSEYSLFHQIQGRADQRSEATLAASRAFSHARSGYHIDPDNHGLNFQDGCSLRWEGQALTWRAPRTPARNLLSSPVQDFTVVKQGSNLILNLVLANHRVNSRSRVPSAFIFSYLTDGPP